MNPSCEDSDSDTEAGDDGYELGDTVLCDATPSLAIDDVRDDLAVPLWLFARERGEAPCGIGVARGDDGVLVMGRGDIRTCAATNGDFPVLDLKQNKCNFRF